MRIKNSSGIKVKVHIYDKTDVVRTVAKASFSLNNGQTKSWSGTSNGYIVTVFKPAILDEYLTHRLVGKNDTMEIKSGTGGSVFGHIGSTATDSFDRLQDSVDDIVASSAAIIKSTPKVLETEFKKAESAIGSEWDQARKTVAGWGSDIDGALVKPVSDVIVDASGAASEVLEFMTNITKELSDMADEFNIVLNNAAQFAMNPTVIESVRKIATSSPVVVARNLAKNIGIGGGIFMGVTMKVEGVSQYAVGATGELEIGYAYFFEGPDKDNVVGVANFNGGVVFGPPGGDVDFGLTVGFIDADMLAYPLFVVVDGQISTAKGGLGVNYIQGLPVNLEGGPPPKIEKFGDGAGLTGYSLVPSPELEGKLSLAVGYLWAWGKGSKAQSGRGATTRGETILSDATGWNDISNYSTIQTAVVDDKLYLLARANNGINTWMWNGNIWLQISSLSPALGDRVGWGDVTNYGTIQTAVLDHTLYLLARANLGMRTWRLDGSDWKQVRTTNPPWNDPEWNDHPNYSTIQTAVVGNTLYLMGMSDTGFETWKFIGNDWSLVRRRNPFNSLWRFASNYSTLQVAAAGNELYMIMRTRTGISTWELENNRWVRVSTKIPPWRSSSSWNKKRHYSTIQLVTVGNTLFLLGRASGGIHTWHYARNFVSPTGGKRWEIVQDNNPPWSDANGWNRKVHYSTIQAAAHGSELYLIGRARNGIHTWRLSNRNASSLNSGWQRIDSGNPAWTNNPGGWQDLSNNDTIQLVSTGRELYLLGRANSGLRMWRLASNRKWERVY